MDTTSLITLLANAAVTILTTVIVTRISLGKPAFFSSATIKSVARKYGAVAFAAFGLILNTYAVIGFLTNGKLITKINVVFTPINAAGAVMFAFMIAGLLASRKKV
jgi:hypothetical protein